MIDYFYMGGPLFMSLISIAGLASVALAVLAIFKYFRGQPISQKLLKFVLIAGSMAFMLGILGQVLGLYQAMSAIQQAGAVSPALLAGGFQVSLVPPMYGLILFILSLVSYLGLIFLSRD